MIQTLFTKSDLENWKVELFFAESKLKGDNRNFSSHTIARWTNDVQYAKDTIAEIQSKLL